MQSSGNSQNNSSLSFFQQKPNPIIAGKYFHLKVEYYIIIIAINGVLDLVTSLYGVKLGLVEVNKINNFAYFGILIYVLILSFDEIVLSRFKIIGKNQKEINEKLKILRWTALFIPTITFIAPLNNLCVIFHIII